MKKIFGVCMAGLLMLVAFTLPAQAQLAAGREYVELAQAISTDNPEKIEVLEFFSYGCSHCNELNPVILDWAKKQPVDVAFKRVPVPWGPFYSLMTKFYYTLEVIGELDRLDSAVFDALHNKRLRLIDEKSLVDWVTSQDVDATKFTAAFRSFSVDSKVKNADQLSRTARIEAVPSLVVDGRYLVLTQGLNAKSHLEQSQALLVRVGEVVEMRRKERAQKK